MTHSGKATEPIFKTIFGKDWDALPVVLQRHYANRPFTDDYYRVTGILDVSCARFLRWPHPLASLPGLIPFKQEKQVPVTVVFESSLRDASFTFNRTFYFQDSKPYVFCSKMYYQGGNHVVEVMGWGISWKMFYFWDGNRVILKHRGYALRVASFFIPLPITWLLGSGYAEERAVDDHHFDMIVHITHPLWGKIYQYNGRFKFETQSV